MSTASSKTDRKYTREHEWAKDEEGLLVVGITAFAVDQLGDVTLVSLDVAPGAQLKAGQIFGTVESVKTLSDLFSPVDGEVVALNELLADSPELLNQDPWEAAWMLKLRPSGSLTDLLEPAAYDELVAASDH